MADKKRLFFRLLAFSFFLGFIFSLSSLSVYSSQTLDNPESRIQIKVGAGIRPPFLIGNNQGMGPEIIAVLNQVQDRYYFQLLPVPISRRVQSVKDGWVDIIMWDNLHWGWADIALEASQQLLESKDLFITLNTDGKSQDYFDNLENHRICVVNGYHYQFLGQSTDYRQLRKKLNLTLVTTEEDAIKMVLHNRCDISLASQSAVDWFFRHQDEYKASDIVISKYFDTEYTRHFLVPEQAQLSVTQINQFIEQANRLNLLKPIYQKYGQAMPF